MNSEFAVSVVLIVVGVLTYAFRNRPNPYIGVRFGYTYLSKEAWRKANTFAGVYTTVLGLLLMILSLTLKIPKLVFLAIILIASAVLIVLTYKIAKETYEMEDMKTPAYVTKPLKTEYPKSYLTIQIAPIVAYMILTAFLWDKIPSEVAIHFDIFGRPDSYADKFIGAVVIPTVAMCVIPLLTILSYKEPMITRLPAFESRSFVFLTVVQYFVAAMIFLALLYNAGFVSGEIIVAFGCTFVVVLVGLVWFMWRR